MWREQSQRSEEVQRFRSPAKRQKEKDLDSRRGRYPRVREEDFTKEMNRRCRDEGGSKEKWSSEKRRKRRELLEIWNLEGSREPEELGLEEKRRT